MLWEAPTLKAAQPFDNMTHVRSRGNLKNLYLHFHDTYEH